MNPTGPSSREVTGLARWSTSDASIATVNGVGFVTAHRRGEVSVRAVYSGADGFMILQVVPGGSRQYFRALSGFVRESVGEAIIGGVTVAIVDGPNAGRSTVTGADGAYQLYDLTLGAFRVRFSKPGYVSAERNFLLTGETFNSLDVFLNRSS
jgi:Carboxypeptidase regulatory-like domain/Bacterial Ig-like domain (group 2)